MNSNCVAVVNRKQLFFCIIIGLMVLIQSPLFCQDLSADNSKNNNKVTVDFNILANFGVKPVIITKDAKALSLGGGVGFGVILNEKFGVGFRFDADYYTHNKPNGTNFAGSDLAFRWSIFGSCVLADFFSLYYSLGFDFDCSSYKFKEYGFVAKKRLGPNLRVEPRFYIPKFKYIDFAAILDVTFGVTEYFNPEIYGAGRINFHPYVNLFSIFAEAGVKYKHYEDVVCQADMSQFALNVGVALDLSVKGKREKEVIAQEEVTSKTSDVSEEVVAEPEEVVIDESLEKMTKAKIVQKMDEETKAQYEDIIQQLERDTGGKVVSFSDILYAPNTDVMLEGSDEVLREVVELLKSDEKYRVNICGYTNELGNDEAQLILSSRRVARVISYLKNNKIPKARYTVAALGGQNAKTEGITRENRRVEIRVLEVKK